MGVGEGCGFRSVFSFTFILISYYFGAVHMSYKAAFAFVISGSGYGVLRLFNGFVFYICTSRLSGSGVFFVSLRVPCSNTRILYSTQHTIQY